MHSWEQFHWDINECVVYCKNYENNVRRAAATIREKFKLGDTKPAFGVVLGSGLNDLADNITNPSVLDYSSIPNFPPTGVQGHVGKLIYGELEGVKVIGMQGRKHYYEGADLPMNIAMLQATFGVQVLAELGIENYFATNAAGGLNIDYNIADMMIINSHIHHMPNPLLGSQHDFKRLDKDDLWRFQPMAKAYDKGLIALLHKASKDYNEKIREGVYMGVTGPTYETNGECIAFRDGFKADAVGMSTTPEIIVANNRGMKCVALSCITNKIAKDGTNATDHEEVKAVLNLPETKSMYNNILRNFFNFYKEDLEFFESLP